jgi:hypothetical protein
VVPVGPQCRNAATEPALEEGLDAVDQIGGVEEFEGFGPLRGGDLRVVGCGFLVGVEDAGFLFLLQGEKEFGEVAFDEFAVEAGFFGGAVDEAAAVGILEQVEGVGVEVFAVAEAQRDAQDFEAVVLFETTDAVLAAAQLERMVVAAFFNH